MHYVARVVTDNHRGVQKWPGALGRGVLFLRPSGLTVKSSRANLPEIRCDVNCRRLGMAQVPRSKINAITYRIIAAAIEVHRQLGPGLLESTYQACMNYELSTSGLTFEANIAVPITYKSVRIDCSYRLDLFVEKLVIVELKSVQELSPVFEAQLLTYMKVKGAPAGLLINFNVPVLRNGLMRRLNKEIEIIDDFRTS